MRVDPIHHRTISEGCPLPQLEAATHTIPLLIISQVRAEIQAGMREFVLHILERGTQRHFQITFFRAEPDRDCLPMMARSDKMSRRMVVFMVPRTYLFATPFFKRKWYLRRESSPG